MAASPNNNLIFVYEAIAILHILLRNAQRGYHFAIVCVVLHILLDSRVLNLSDVLHEIVTTIMCIPHQSDINANCVCSLLYKV